MGIRQTGRPAPTCPGSPGRRSSATTWSRAGRRPTTPRWPGTGPPAAGRSRPRRSARTGSACSGSSKDAARCAGTSCCTPTASPRAPQNGSNGPPRSGRRSATRDHRTGQPGGQSGKAPHPRALPEAARPPTAERHHWRTCEPSGTCLSRGAGKARKPGSEGRAAQQMRRPYPTAHPHEQAPHQDLRLHALHGRRREFCAIRSYLATAARHGIS